jgi:hypothetical protein
VFCPNCGVEDRQQGQFCRACGIDLSGTRAGLMQTDSVGSAVTAHEEIGRAVAAKIRELRGARDLKKIAEDVLPQVEKFLESPEERRLRRIRSGMIMSSIGLGALLFFTLLAATDRDALPTIAIGAAAFLIGLAFLVNGWHFSIQSRPSDDDADRKRLRDLLGSPERSVEMRYIEPPSSVVENTTRTLDDGATGVSRPRATGE